jgi:hypothetical protein
LSTINPLLSLIQGVTTSTAVNAPAVKVGTIVDALVLQMLTNGTAKLATAQGRLEGKSEATLVPGSLVRLEVTAPGQLRLVATLAGAGAGGSTGPQASGRLDTAQTLPTATPAGAPPSTMDTQAAVVTHATLTAAGQQRSLAPLLADLAGLVSRPDNPLPAPVRAAAAAVLALPLDAEGLDAATLRDAFARSGLFREAHLASAGIPARDLKSSLLALRDALQGWRASLPAAEAGSRASPAPPVLQVPHAARPAGEALAHTVAQSLSQAVAANPRVLTPLVALGPQRVLLEALAKETQEAPPLPSAAVAEPESTAALKPPPYRHGPLSPQPAAGSALALDAAPEEIATKLLTATEGALARHTLTQIASLPEASAGELARGERAPASWTFELPMRTPEGTAVVPFEIARDGRGPNTAEGEAEAARSWRARFSTDLPLVGPVHAQVTLTGERAAVTLWAESDDTVAMLREGIPILEAALREAALEPGALRIRQGAPCDVPAGPGKFLDHAT